MKTRILLMCSCVLLLLCGCLLFPRKNEIGAHWIQNPNVSTISMDEICKVLSNSSLNYKMELIPVSSNTTIILTSSGRERVYASPHHFISMGSDTNWIDIQYTVENPRTEGPITGIIIRYYLKGDNRHARLSELNEPMEKIKTILMDNFSLLQEKDFTELFIPYPVH